MQSGHGLPKLERPIPRASDELHWANTGGINGNDGCFRATGEPCEEARRRSDGHVFRDHNGGLIGEGSEVVTAGTGPFEMKHIRYAACEQHLLHITCGFKDERVVSIRGERVLFGKGVIDEQWAARFVGEHDSDIESGVFFGADGRTHPIQDAAGFGKSAGVRNPAAFAEVLGQQPFNLLHEFCLGFGHYRRSGEQAFDGL